MKSQNKSKAKRENLKLDSRIFFTFNFWLLTLARRVFAETKFFKIFVTFVVVSLFFATFCAGASDMQRLDGKIIKVDTANQTFLAEIIHPATGEKFEKEFKVDHSTGFKRVKKLERVKPGDLASIDYREENGKAVAIYVDLLPGKGDFIVTPAELAQSILKLGRKNNSVQQQSPQAIAKETPKDEGARYFQNHEYEKAKTSFLRSVELQPNDAESRFYLGQAYLALGQMADAKSAFEKTLELNPNHLGASYGLGLILDEAKSPDAEKYFRKVVQQDPKMKDAHFRLGSIYYSRERFAKAEEAFRRVAEIDPKDASAFYNLGLAESRQGKFELARESFRTVSKIDPANSAAIFQTAFAYEMQGFYDEAKNFYRETIRLNPADLDAQERLQSLDKGISLGRGPIDRTDTSPFKMPFGDLNTGRQAMESLLPHDRFGALLGDTGPFGSGISSNQDSSGKASLLQAGLAVLSQMMKNREQQ